MVHRKIAIIGRSGSGKSSLSKLLRENTDIPVINEIARHILDVYPNYSPQHKQYKMLYLQLGSEEDFERAGLGFITDRGLHDYCIYSNEVGLKTPFYDEKLPYRYDFVFKMPNRPFKKKGRDGERVEKDEQEASRLQDLIDEKYLSTGHEIITLPKSSLINQYNFIKRKLNI